MVAVLSEHLRLQHAVIRLDREVARLEAADTPRGAAAAARDTLDRLEQLRDELRSLLSLSAAAEAAAEHELRALRASWSWRITRPLRWVASQLRGGKTR